MFLFKVLKFSLPVIISTLFLSSCGLPYFTVVDEPIVASGDTSIIGFTAPADDTYISGYEIYYKIYDTLDSTTINADKDKFNTSSTTYTYQFGSTKPLALGFKRFLYGTDSWAVSITNAIPLISTEVSQPVKLQSGKTLKISLTNDGEITIDGIPIGYYPLRSVLDSNEFYKLFSDIVVGDADRGSIGNDVTQYTISFVAFSYVSSIITSYQSSIPIFLGSIEKSN